jgi:hypothetical protein
VGNLVYYLILLIGFLLCLLSLLFLYLTIRKAIENNIRNKIDAYKEENRDHVFRFLYKGEMSRHLLPDNQIKYVAIEELLNEFANVVEGEELENRMGSFAEMYFLNRYKKNLSHRRWSIRMNVLYNIESFRMEKLLDDVVNLYTTGKNLSEAEAVQILKIMVKFDHPELFNHLISNKHDFSEFVYRLLFSNMTDETLDVFLENFYKLPDKLKLTIIDIVGIENRHECSLLLKAQLIDEKDEIRIRSLKALSHLSTPLTKEELKRHLISENYEERIIALKVCASVRKKEYIPLIIERMSDAMFVVRQQAGQAIYRYPNGIELLREILLQSNDKFARDMALEWLEKGS